MPAVFALVIGGPFFAEFIASLVVGMAAMLFVQLGLGSQLDKIIIGAVMPLVPGLLITNAAKEFNCRTFSFRGCPRRQMQV